MSILLVRLTTQGIVMAADRNVTDVFSDQSSKLHEPICKVQKWKNNKAIIGYIGMGEIGGESAENWFSAFIIRNESFYSLEDLAKKLIWELNPELPIDVGGRKPIGLLIHLAGFEVEKGHLTPKIYFITNIWGMKNGFYDEPRFELKLSDELWTAERFLNVSITDVRTFLTRCENDFNPWGFQHTYDLLKFNILDLHLKEAFKILFENFHKHSIPRNIKEWEQFIKLEVLLYGAYYESFFEPEKRIVGGGADAVSLEWKTLAG